jgi:hypothetical protein
MLAMYKWRVGDEPLLSIERWMFNRRSGEKWIDDYRKNGLFQLNPVSYGHAKPENVATYQQKPNRSEERARNADCHSLHIKIHAQKK